MVREGSPFGSSGTDSPQPRVDCFPSLEPRTKTEQTATASIVPLLSPPSGISVYWKVASVTSGVEGGNLPRAAIRR